MAPPLTIHLVPLDAAPAGDESLLTAGERDRLARLARPELRARFLARRLALRRLLADQLGVAPAEVRFRVGPHGKPELDLPRVTLHFNASSRGGLALIATAEVPVGVDVEEVTAVPEAAPLSAQHFDAAARQAVEQASPGERDRVFLQCWTRKEAFAKACGAGLDLELAAIPTGLGTGGPDVIEAAGGVWTLWNLDLGLGRVGAVCLAGRHSGAPALAAPRG